MHPHPLVLAGCTARRLLPALALPLFMLGGLPAAAQAQALQLCRNGGGALFALPGCPAGMTALSVGQIAGLQGPQGAAGPAGPGGRNLPDQFRWNDLAAVRPAIQDRLHL